MKYLKNSETELEIEGSKVQVYFFSFKESNPYLIMLHGLSADTQRMKGLIEILEDKYNVISLDLPGFGKSREFDNEENYIEYTSKLLESFLKELNFKNSEVVLFGGSNGANIVINYMFDHPTTDFNKIVLFAPIFSYKNLSMTKSYRRFLRWISTTTAKGGPTSKLIQKVIDSDKLYDPVAKLLDRDARHDKEILDYQKGLWRLMKITHWGKTLKEFLEIDYSDNKVVMNNENVVFIYPKKDQYLDVESTVENFKLMIPNARILYYDSVKHMPKKDFMEDEIISRSIRSIIEKI